MRVPAEKQKGREVLQHPDTVTHSPNNITAISYLQWHIGYISKSASYQNGCSNNRALVGKTKIGMMVNLITPKK